QDLALSEATASLERSYRTQGYDGLIDAIGERGRTNGVVTFGYALFDATGKKVAGSFELDLPPPGYSNVVFRDPVEGPDHARALTTRLDR
ncbi:UNVERIFIED_CONTAM: histidine kinase, partial [Bacteroidetes bacterium 56_B9]